MRWTETNRVNPDSDKVIRPATVADGPAIFELVNQLHETITVARAPFFEAFPSVLNNPNHCCLVADSAGRVVGYAAGYKHVTLAASRHVAFLDEIVISPDLRGGGLGKSLMIAFEDWAARNQCKMVSLATGGARGFYEQLGYTSRAGYYKKNLDADQVRPLPSEGGIGQEFER